MRRFVLGALASAVLSIAAYAQGFVVTITVDESGHARFQNSAGFDQTFTGVLAPDPGPGGLAAALTYNLFNPPGLTAGDLILTEPGGGISDVIRFNPDENGGSLVFYSDISDGADALADTGFPTAFYANTVTFEEVGPEGNNGFIYTPTAGQPGYVSGVSDTVVHFVILSDVTAIPETPSSVAILLTIVALGGYGLKRRAAA